MTSPPLLSTPPALLKTRGPMLAPADFCECWEGGRRAGTSRAARGGFFGELWSCNEDGQVHEAPKAGRRTRVRVSLLPGRCICLNHSWRMDGGPRSCSWGQVVPHVLRKRLGRCEELLNAAWIRVETCSAPGALINETLLLPLPPTYFHFHFTCGTQHCDPQPGHK